MAPDARAGLSGLVASVPPDIRRSAWVSLRAAPVAAVLGIAFALLLPKQYLSTASFVAENQNLRGISSSLSALADQFGVLGGSLGGGAQSPAFFADLLESRAILLPILNMNSTTVGDADPSPLIDRLKVGGPDLKDREERGLRRLRSMLEITPDAKTNVVTFGVAARDPQLAYEIAQALLQRLDSFNVSVRRSRAKNERAFLEGRVADAQTDLRAAEAELEEFENANRDSRFPSLAFREARLKRKVDLAQTRFVQLQTQLDQARVQEVRDTPVITVLDKPNLPERHFRPRRTVVALVVLVLGMLGAYGYSRLTTFRGEDWPPPPQATDRTP